MSATAKPGCSDEAVRAEAVAWLAKLRSGPGVAEEAVFEDWYAADPRHATIYDGLLDNWEKMGAAALTPIGKPRARQSRRPPRHVVAAAAALFAVVLAGAEFYHLGLIGAPAPATEIASRVGEIRPLALPDGSRVTLDTASTIRFAFSNSQRHVTLVNGRARFDVAHDTSRPFIVIAGSSQVIAHGTLFDVALHEGSLTVSLLRGSVEVRTSPRAAGRSPETSRKLQPGQSLSIETNAAPGLLAPVTPEEERWPTGMQSFDNVSLEDIIGAINRYGATRIILADRSAASVRYTGTLSTKDPVGVARMIAASNNLVLSRDGRGDVILGPATTLQK